MASLYALIASRSMRSWSFMTSMALSFIALSFGSPSSWAYSQIACLQSAQKECERIEGHDQEPSRAVGRTLRQGALHRGRESTESERKRAGLRPLHAHL